MLASRLPGAIVTRYGAEIKRDASYMCCGSFPRACALEDPNRTAGGSLQLPGMAACRPVQCLASALEI
jgi:hypothetical protein